MSRSSPDIVIVAIDTLRPDHLGCYGYDRATSPEIDALAAESIVFEGAFAAGIPTMPSFTTLLTGLHPYRHGIVSHISKRRLAEKILSLPQLLKQRGYITAAYDNLVVQGNGRGSWFARGYDYYSGFVYKPFTDQGRQLTERALNFIQDDTEHSLFLFMHYWDPHTPYGPLPPYDMLHYEPGSSSTQLAEVKNLHPSYYAALLRSMKLRYPDDYAYIVAQYDGEISQVDVEVGRLIQSLKVRGNWDNTIFLLLSDHGECFGEGGFYFDHHGLYDAVTHIALLLRLPDQKARRIKALVSHEDILPTLSELVGLPELPYPLTGTSIVPLLSGKSDTVRSWIISAESTRQASLALRTLDWKIILPIVEDAQGQPLPDFYGNLRSAEPFLFDLRSDFGEQRNLSRDHPGKLTEMLTTLAEWRAEMARITGEPDPIQSQGLTLPYARFMERVLAQS